MQTDANPIQKEISAANQSFMDAYQRKDAAGIAALYSEQGQILPPNTNAITGRNEIQGFWQAAMDMGIATVKLASAELDIHAGTAIEVGRFNLLGAAGQEMEQGKYIVVWKKEQGQWRLHRDIWNSSPSGK